MLDTKTMTREEWLMERRKGIGGSDVATILGLTENWRTAYELWEEKTNKVPIEESTALRLKVGQKCEQVVADLFTEETGIAVQKRNAIFQHKKYPWLLANIDRYCVGQSCGLECKTVENMGFLKDEWGPSSTAEAVNDKIPFRYYPQVMHYMNVLEMDRFFVAALIGFADFRWYVIPWDQPLWDGIFDKLEQFWFGNVQADIPPDPVNLSDLAKLYSKANLEPIEATAQVAYAVQKHVRMKKAEKAIKAQKADLAFEIQSFMGDHNALLGADGSVVTTWKKSAKSGRRTFLTKESK